MAIPKARLPVPVTMKPGSTFQGQHSTGKWNLVYHGTNPAGDEVLKLRRGERPEETLHVQFIDRESRIHGFVRSVDKAGVETVIASKPPNNETALHRAVFRVAEEYGIEPEGPYHEGVWVFRKRK
jgi:hypothetical protein